ncbi:MAG: DAK2 domain-containing protein [Lachnospiraceae bacterium]|nr:DAK2 domain-containing protein [Lachnospiraceae bacterium]
MALNTLDAKMIAKMFLAGAKNLEAQKEHINELNVFPVPDGDTGTNMTLTIMSAAKDVYSLKNPDMATLCKSISSGSLRGARGNSGVILSQLFRGFNKVVKSHDEIDIAVISAGCDKAVESAYKAVMQPKEGTILTVAKGIAEKANEVFESGETSIEALLVQIIDHAKKVLEETPELLPVLKEAGVVDSGGAGLVAVLEGMYDGFLGKGIEFTMDEATSQAAGEIRLLHQEEPKKPEYKFLYHTTISLELDKAFRMQSEHEVRKYLEAVGDEVAIAVDESIVNVSLNTNDPGMAIQKALKYGELIDVQVLNRKHTQKEAAQGNTAGAAQNAAAKPVPQPKKEVGFIAVSAGDGISEILKNLGVDYLIEGGQTMNPSTEDMLNAIEYVNADHIFIFPNNKNIILAANQARDMTKDKDIIVMPSKTVPQCISAMIAYMPDSSVKENEEGMNEAMNSVQTGQVTYAVRDTSIDGVEIHQDDYMGIGDKGILSNGRDIEKVIIGMLDKMVSPSSELISIYYGADVEESAAESVRAKISETYNGLDVEFQKGGQPVYYYILSVE